MNLRLSELKQKCADCGLSVKQSGKRPAKEDYINSLRAFYLKRDYPDGLPYRELSPMLCHDYWGLKQREREEIWKDYNFWLVQEKFNGVRAVVHFVAGKGVFIHGRNLDSQTFRCTDLSQHCVFTDTVPTFTATLDCEVCCERQIDTSLYTPKGSVIPPSLQAVCSIFQLKSESARALQNDQQAWVKFKVFDVANWQGKDLRKRELAERLPIIADVLAVMDKDLAWHFEVVPHQAFGKKLFMEQVLSRGGEGVVFKNIHSLYFDDGTRDRKGWVKFKRTIELDAKVSGFELGKATGRMCGKIATLCFTIDTDAGPHLIAKVSHVSQRLRKAITVRNQEKQIVLHPNLAKQTAHLVGTELSPKALRLVQPRIVGWTHMGVETRTVYSSKHLREGQLHIPFVENQENDAENRGSNIRGA